MKDDKLPWSYVKIELTTMDFEADLVRKSSRMEDLGDFNDPEYIQRLQRRFEEILEEDFRRERNA